MKIHPVLLAALFTIATAGASYAQSGSGSASGAASGGAFGSGKPSGSGTASGGGAFNSGRPSNPPTTLNSSNQAQVEGSATLKEDINRIEQDGVRSREGNGTTFDSPSERRTDMRDMDKDGVDDTVDNDLNSNTELEADVDANVGGVNTNVDLNTGVRVPANQRNSNPGLLNTDR